MVKRGSRARVGRSTSSTPLSGEGGELVAEISRTGQVTEQQWQVFRQYCADSTEKWAAVCDWLMLTLGLQRTCIPQDVRRAAGI